MEILIYLLIFYFGLMAGFFLHIWVKSKASYTGTIYVSKEDEKTLYSLVLNDYPDSIAFEKEVVFKVDASKIDIPEEESDRK